MEHEVTISHLRDTLGVADLHVGRTDEPVIVHRYGKAKVALVPLWEWRFFKKMEEAIRAGRIDVSEFIAERGMAWRSVDALVFCS
jgi:hypothetical protein